MEFHQLQAFVTVAEEGSVTAAARRLYASQPAISAQIKALEQSLGISLFHRSAAGMVLTDEGQTLIRHAHHVLRGAEQFKVAAERATTASAGSVIVGLNNINPEVFSTEQAVSNLIAEQPGINLQIDYGPSAAILRGIRKQKIDLGFAEGTISDPTLHRFPLGNTPMRIIVPAAWRERCGEYDWEKLESVPWAFTSPDCSYNQLLEEVAHEHGLTLRTQFRIDHNGTAVGIVRRGLAVSMVDLQNAKAAERDGDVYIWPGFEAELPIGLYCLATRKDEPTIVRMFEVCQKMTNQAAVNGRVTRPTPRPLPRAT